MVLTDVITLVSLLSLGGIIGVAGFRRLFLLDRLRWEYIRQNACRWHRWQRIERENSLVCGLCGKKSSPSRDRDPETLSSGNLFPP